MASPSDIRPLLTHWRNDPQTAPNITAWETLPPRAARLESLPPNLPGPLARALEKSGIHAFYGHQAEAWRRARAGEHLVLATGTASGKTLAYNLPVLAALLEDPQARALYLFPTKALAQDQLAALERLSALPAAIYDGDTPQSKRAAIRTKARLLFTNPDMLHTGILPHHTKWEGFFRHLRFVVVDEMHTYRGVFGSHVANLFRRLKRVAAFYGATPQFILTSATIGNPRQLAERLIEAPVALIAEDGAARGERHFLIYNPPVTDPALGLRKSALAEATRLAGEALAQGVQSVVFARSRRSVEMMLKGMRETASPSQREGIRGYRSGYLPSERREIERGLREGSVRLVIATNALELGIDIGALSLAVLTGYPGSVASTRQQAGRAGRGEAPAAAVLVVSPDPLDQFLAHHPEYLLGRSPEQALINPDHLLILLSHLRCAAFELPFREGERFGNLPTEDLRALLEALAASGELHRSNGSYFWMADDYPAARISLRSASPERVVLQSESDPPRVIGEVDRTSAPWMVHPGAVYLHEGREYLVRSLDLENGLARLVPAALDYYTEPQRATTLHILNRVEETAVRGGEKGWGELRVVEQVVGFKKRRWFTRETLGEEPLDLPPNEFQTIGYWLFLSEETVSALRETGAWRGDPNDYGPEWPRLRARVRARDGYRCRLCGAPEGEREHHVHHKVPFRAFASPAEANRLDNLITLCASCHRRVETAVRVRSGLAGLGYALHHLAPLFLMCDRTDLGLHVEARGEAAVGRPAVILYDRVPAGIGFGQRLFELHDDLLARAWELVSRCPCQDGCPSCVGPGGENGLGGKAEAMRILEILVGWATLRYAP
ncbi:MAG: DEAD/DEAH box helicase [Anaerolineae bacterium]|nr:MAG: DEAD/DEAH box helicase [Anaerolineae bacterium]